MSSQTLKDDGHSQARPFRVKRRPLNLAEKSEKASQKQYTARALCAKDARQLRTIRLESLRFFGSILMDLHDRELRKPLSFWQKLATPTNNQCLFGLFDGEQLVAILAAKRLNKKNFGHVICDKAMAYDPRDETALWYSAYAKPEYRGQGLLEPLYIARENWTRRRFKVAEFFIHRISCRSKIIHMKRGAKYICTRRMGWPGCPQAIWHWYRKELTP